MNEIYDDLMEIEKLDSSSDDMEMDGSTESVGSIGVGSIGEIEMEEEMKNSDEVKFLKHILREEIHIAYYPDEDKYEAGENIYYYSERVLTNKFTKKTSGFRTNCFFEYGSMQLVLDDAETYVDFDNCYSSIKKLVDTDEYLSQYKEEFMEKERILRGTHGENKELMMYVYTFSRKIFKEWLISYTLKINGILKKYNENALIYVEDINMYGGIGVAYETDELEIYRARSYLKHCLTEKTNKLYHEYGENKTMRDELNNVFEYNENNLRSFCSVIDTQKFFPREKKQLIYEKIDAAINAGNIFETPGTFFMFLSNETTKWSDL